MIRAAQPDVVGLVEATNPCVVEELAKRLGMDHRMSGRGEHVTDWHVALLSRLPIIHTQVHVRPERLSKPLLEVGVQEEHGGVLTLFVTHLKASFAGGIRGGDGIRREEAREVARIMKAKRGTPHLLMGDLNSLAPGDTLRASRLLRYLVNMDELHRAQPQESVGHPYLDFVVPPSLRFLEPLMRLTARNVFLSALFDGAGSLYVARSTIRLLRKAGYVDCFRSLHREAEGFTCPASVPSGRIDYIFASPELAPRLTSCRVVTEADGVRGEQASDHLPVVAEFREK
jgi:endonuclease/exonuclease/phosphatase family metal-dependent hydrolase